MRISSLRIENFRGIVSGTVLFRNHTVLIGPNNSGKTTIIEALALVLGRDRLVRTLTEHDFYGSDPGALDRIKLVAIVTGFEPEDPTAHPDWFRDGRGVPYWFDEKTGEILPEKANADQKLACEIVFSARFDRETLEVETARYFNDNDEIDVFAEDNYVRVPGNLIRDLGFFLVPATRSWDRMLSFASELFRRVIRSAGGLPAESVLAERDRLRQPQQPLEDDALLRPIINQVNAEMTALLGRTVPLHLRITETDSTGVLEAAVPHYQTANRVAVPAKREGSGLVSLQSLFLLLHFGQKRIEEGESFLMALEEPELHLPPSIQRRVLSRLQALSTQTIVSTHSPLVASYCEATSLLIVRNADGVLTATPMLPQALQQDAINSVRKLFQINRVETAAALMSEFVLIPEGRFDFDWLSLILRAAEMVLDERDPCLFGVRVGIVPTHNGSVRETCKAIAQSHPHVIALLDGDGAGREYADQLDQLERGASKVIRWPNNWTIEDFVGWIISADEAVVIDRLNQEIQPPPRNLETLIARLKLDDKQSPERLKGDGVAYEVIASAICDHPLCRARARAALQAIAQACAGEETPHATVEQRAANPIPRITFTPW